MDFSLSPRAADLQRRLLSFMDEAVIPAEPVFAEEMRASGDPHFHPHVMEDQPPVRPARRDHRTKPGTGTGGLQLLGT